MSSLPRAQELINLGPAKTGYCEKKSRGVGPSLCPCLFSQFKPRYFILIGNFLIRYESELGGKPKGVPLPLDALTVVRLDHCTFKLAMLRKDYIIRAPDESECVSWIHAINTRKAGAVRENMGHAPLAPAIAALNRAASKAFLDKLDKEAGAAQDASVANPLNAHVL